MHQESGSGRSVVILLLSDYMKKIMEASEFMIPIYVNRNDNNMTYILYLNREFMVNDCKNKCTNHYKCRFNRF